MGLLGIYVTAQKIAPQDLEGESKEEQCKLGQMNFLSGFVLGDQMVLAQQQQLQSIGSRKGGAQEWAGKIILHYWNIVQNMWLGHNEILNDIFNSISGEAILDHIDVQRKKECGAGPQPANNQKKNY